MTPEISFIIGLAVLILLAVRFRINAFVALLISALTIGLLSGMGGTEVVNAITRGFGDIISKIGIVIILGVMLGKVLEGSGGAEKMARSAIHFVGEKRGPFAMAVSGFLIAIPVYSDVGYVILSPLTKALSRKSKTCLAVIAVSLSAGLLATHVFVPPTPGPLALVGLLNIDMGDMIIWGSFAAAAMTLSGWFYAQFIMPKYLKPILPDGPDDYTESQDMPNLFYSTLPLLVPIILILLNTTAGMLISDKNDLIYISSQFVGNPIIAMGIGVGVAIVLLGNRLGGDRPARKMIDASVKDAGPIIFITAAGGSLGQVLETSGAGKAIADLVVSSGLPFILLPFLVSGILKTIQGSGTVALITAATLCLPIAHALSVNPILIALAAGSGARLICHVNDSYFWVYTNKTGLKTLSLANIFMALGGLFATWIVSFVI
jgi:GntP family gluconate:H+ symporter